MAVKKSRQFPGFLIYSQLKTSAFTAAKSNAKFQTRYLKGAPLNQQYLCLSHGFTYFLIIR